ncbi:MAG: Asp-tRNA(Asn)/Glu-tRNA(Gln) amidotransferase subunit GatA [Kiritimatiellia bacterium]
MSINLKGLTIVKALRALESGAISSVELVRTLLAAMEASQKEIHAFVTIDGEAALKQAAECDALRAAGTKLPLLGIPIAIKDNMNVTGQPCTASSRILEGYCAPYDATVIARLRAAGAIFLGRTNMDEFALGSTTQTSGYGPTENPVARGCIPGGSSGGSAAAVGGDLAICALGSDTGGSIRQPASHCGLVGLKPTYGRVSRYGIVACASSLDQVGPMTKTVEDAALLMNVLSGRDCMDATSLDLPVPDYTQAWANDSGTQPLKGMTIGLPKEYFVEGLNAEVQTITNAAIDRMKSLGATVKSVSLPHSDFGIPTYYICMTAEISANLARFDGVRYGLRVPCDDVIEQYKKTRAAGFGAETKRRILLGTFVLSSGYADAYYNRAQKVRTLIRQDLEKAFKECDILLSPVTPEPAWPLGVYQNDPIKNYLSDVLTVGVNLAGCCAIAIPAGVTVAGKPVGVQFIGPNFGEEVLFRAAHAFETVAKEVL